MHLFSGCCFDLVAPLSDARTDSNCYRIEQRVLAVSKRRISIGLARALTNRITTADAANARHTTPFCCRCRCRCRCGADESRINREQERVGAAVGGKSATWGQSRTDSSPTPTPPLSEARAETAMFATALAQVALRSDAKRTDRTGRTRTDDWQQPDRRLEAILARTAEKRPPNAELMNFLQCPCKIHERALSGHKQLKQKPHAD